jgi:GMP synthase (glutamine-hydrolysing)
MRQDGGKYINLEIAIGVNNLKGEINLPGSESFYPTKFVEAQVTRIREVIGKEKALVAVSGGVDSTTCAVLVNKAIGENLVCIIIDDAFMREGEPEHVAEILAKDPFNVQLKIVNARERFLSAMKGLRDAEEKRKVFRETFYTVLSELAGKEKCQVLVQGTIRADIIETVGGIKTQHNVLEQMGINTVDRYGFKVVEPLVTLYKGQVRMVARYLGLPAEFAERQPFPGPGLSVRVVGEIRPDKLETVKKATTIAECELAKFAPSQYFATIIDNEAVEDPRKVQIQQAIAQFLNIPLRSIQVQFFADKATGVKSGKRSYGKIIGLKVKALTGKPYQASIQKLIALQAGITEIDPTIARVLYAIEDLPEKKPYVVGLRVVQTKDFLTAEVAEIPWATLGEIAEEIVKRCPNVSTVYYDVTPKPPATIEME